MPAHKEALPLKQQVLRFVLSAGAGFAVDMCCFYLFYHNLLSQKRYDFLGYSVRNSTLSLLISFFLGVMVNFLMTRYIVFTESRTSFSKQLSRFLAVAFIGFFANKILLDAMITYGKLFPPVARVTAALSLFFASFFVHKVFSFSLSLRNQHQHEPAPADTSASS